MILLLLSEVYQSTSALPYCDVDVNYCNFIGVNGFTLLSDLRGRGFCHKAAMNIV